ncbi:alpha/beta hydrolase-fold protein [Verrucomicrobiota bacterium sgz303538]
MFSPKAVRFFTCIVVFLTAAADLRAAKLEVHSVPGVTLQENPLGDPPARRLAVFTPDGIAAASPLPIVIYLPGWGGSSEGAIAEGNSGMFGKVVDQLTSQGIPLRLAVVDGRSRYGGSQFLNSSATGNYADYVSREILPELKTRYAVPKDSTHSCIIAGHSSGAYGALMLAVSRKEAFDAVVALSPDSDFETTHKPLVQAPAVRNVTREELNAAMDRPGQTRLPKDGYALLIMGLCANYVPAQGQPGRFEWLYDERGAWRPEVWQRWLDLDPLNVIRQHGDAFASEQRIYLDGAEHDEFGANIGARKIHEVLRQRKSPVTFYESPGHHSDRLGERLVRGLTWAFAK